MSGFSQKYKFDQANNSALVNSIHVGALVKVVVFDKAKMTVDVLPISKRLTGGEYATPSQVLGVPVAVTRSGGFLYRPFIKEGDIGVILYLDHDIDKTLETADECKPNTERTHSDSDAVFIGGIIAGDFECPDLPDGMVMATENGDIYLAVTERNIQIKGDVVVEGDVVADAISLKEHKHRDVESGAGISGTPV